MALTKIFKSGNSLAVRIPKEFEAETGEVEITRLGDGLFIRKRPKNLASAYDLLISLPDDFFKDGREQPPLEEREGL